MGPQVTYKTTDKILRCRLELQMLLFCLSLSIVVHAKRTYIQYTLSHHLLDFSKRHCHNSGKLL